MNTWIVVGRIGDPSVVQRVELVKSIVGQEAAKTPPNAGIVNDVETSGKTEQSNQCTSVV